MHYYSTETHFPEIVWPRLAGWIIGVVAITYGVALFSHSLVPSMEPRFAEVVKEMLDSGQWLIPLKNGRPYVEYPPLYYWLAYLGAKSGLPILVAIRLPAYAALLAWLLLLNRWQRLLFTGWPSYTFVLLGAAVPLAMFQFAIAQTDSLLVLGTLLAVYGYSIHRVRPVAHAFPWMIWLGVALATAAKGPVGVACTLPIFVIDSLLATLFYAKDQNESIVKSGATSLWSLCWVRGLSLVLLVNAPWYVVAGFSRSWEFVNAILVYQNFDRYVSGYSHWQPWWYYLKTIIYDFFPLSLLLPIGIHYSLRRLQEHPVRLTLIWALYTFVFFSISASKQGKYLLPAAPAFIALAVVALDGLHKQWQRSTWSVLRAWSIFIIGLWGIFIAIALPQAAPNIGGVNGFAPIKEQLYNEPAPLVHYQWPRSLTLYELGAPMEFVRSSRELYQKIHSGEISEGAYILVKQSELGIAAGADQSLQLIPYPNPNYFAEILQVDIDKPATLLRVQVGASDQPVPPTPMPRAISWRDELFDTD